MVKIVRNADGFTLDCDNPKDLKVGLNVDIRAKTIKMGNNVHIGNNVKIRSTEIIIGDDVTFGDDCDIFTYENFTIGKGSYLGTAKFRGKTIVLGEEFYGSRSYTTPLTIGGGGWQGPDATCKIGNRCTMHDTFINIAKPVDIGNDVGLSPDTKIITHGYWQSILDGHSAIFKPVNIEDNVWVGIGAVILPGVTIGKSSIIGANSVVTHALPARSIAVGSPARVVKPAGRDINELDKAEKLKVVLCEYARTLKYKGFDVDDLSSDGIIFVSCNNAVSCITIGVAKLPTSKSINNIILLNFGKEHYNEVTAFKIVLDLENLTVSGNHTDLSDDFRDFIRRYGLRFYGRPFKSIKPKIQNELENL